MHQMMLKRKDSFEYYKSTNPKTTIDYKTYSEICTKLNQVIIDWMLLGNPFDMKWWMSTIEICRFERRFYVSRVTGRPKLAVNFGETRKLKAKGIDKVVYYTDPWYCGFSWRRVLCRVPGKGAYKFEASRTNGALSKIGSKNKLVSLLKLDELAHLRFKFLKPPPYK